MLPKRVDTVRALSASPENAPKYKNRTDQVANASHAKDCRSRPNY